MKASQHRQLLLIGAALIPAGIALMIAVHPAFGLAATLIGLWALGFGFLEYWSTLRSCPRCRLPLLKREVYCPDCGVYGGKPPADGNNSPQL